jgi:hypothetical protein
MLDKVELDRNFALKEKMELLWANEQEPRPASPVFMDSSNHLIGGLKGTSDFANSTF